MVRFLTIWPKDATYFYEKDLVEFDADYDKQVELQYDENIKLFEAKQGYIEANKEFKVTLNPIQKIENKENIQNPLKQIKEKIEKVPKQVKETIKGVSKRTNKI